MDSNIERTVRRKQAPFERAVKLTIVNTMKCFIPGINVKIFGRAIHVLAKIGDELYLESTEKGLALRTINRSESVYCLIVFGPAFFTYFKYDRVSTDDDEGATCKISMKSALNVFKSPAHMDKQVEMCEINPDFERNKLVFLLRCKHGIVKTHSVSILESKKMEAAYSKDGAPNRFCILNRTLSEIVSGFQLGDDQITFDATPEVFKVRNYSDDVADASKINRTQLSVRPSEFKNYVIGAETSVSFVMREFRAILSFAEALDLPIYCGFETSGKPIVFTISNVTTFEADFVMATERFDDVTQPPDRTVERNASRATKRTASKANDSKATKKLHLEKENDLMEEDSHLFTLVQMPDGDYEVPSSPVMNTQTSKIRTVFKRCFEKTINPGAATLISDILASDSDSED